MAAASPPPPAAQGLDCLPCHASGGILCECQCRPAAAEPHPGSDVEQTPALTLAELGGRDGGARGGGGGSRGDEGRDACVLYHEGGGIATMTLNRPKVRVCV